MVKVTEERNKNSMEIDQLDTHEMLSLISDEDLKVAKKVREEIPTISKVVDEIYNNLSKGGRLYYVGAGTSGRIGVLDAVECSPTFSVDSDKIIALMAGGREAIFKARENIEDKYETGKGDIKAHDPGENDCVVGISASGKTPYVLGAVKEANKNNSLTIGLVCNEDTIIEANCDLTIAPILGPEVITGSTRMKAGTAQKMVLNMISTSVMIKLGKVYSNLMVDLNVTNKKLETRAKKIFSTITDTNKKIAGKYLKKADYNVKQAIVMHEKDCSLEVAREILDNNNGVLREIIN